MSSTLEGSLYSIINHLDNNFEIIIVDDGSNDDSLERLFEIEKNFKAVESKLDKISNHLGVNQVDCKKKENK